MCFFFFSALSITQCFKIVSAVREVFVTKEMGATYPNWQALSLLASENGNKTRCKEKNTHKNMKASEFQSCRQRLGRQRGRDSFLVFSSQPQETEPWKLLFPPRHKAGAEPAVDLNQRGCTKKECATNWQVPLPESHIQTNKNPGLKWSQNENVAQTWLNIQILI